MGGNAYEGRVCEMVGEEGVGSAGGVGHVVGEVVTPVATVDFWCNRLRKRRVVVQVVFDDIGRT